MLVKNGLTVCLYHVYQRFGQAKFPDGGSVLGSKFKPIFNSDPAASKILLNSKVVKIDPKNASLI
jgi:hypothetical protein